MAWKMKVISKISLRFLYKAFCVVCVLCMVLYWFYKFEVEDRDIGIVHYESFKDGSNIPYPVASLCFEQPFSRRKVSLIDPGINVTNYLMYLEGDIIEEEFKDVDYLGISLNLDDYLNGYWLYLRNGTDLENTEVATFSNKVNFNGYSEWKEFLKCFELSWNIASPGITRESFV